MYKFVKNSHSNIVGGEIMARQESRNSKNNKKNNRSEKNNNNKRNNNRSERKNNNNKSEKNDSDSDCHRIDSMNYEISNEFGFNLEPKFKLNDIDMTRRILNYSRFNKN